MKSQMTRQAMKMTKTKKKRAVESPVQENRRRRKIKILTIRKSENSSTK